MLGPRSRSEIDFLEKKSEKVANAIPPLVSYCRDITQVAKRGGLPEFATFSDFFSKKSISERLCGGPSMPKIYSGKLTVDSPRPASTNKNEI